MEALGHRQISTTMDIYTKVYPVVHRKAAEALDKVLGPTLESSGQRPRVEDDLDRAP